MWNTLFFINAKEGKTWNPNKDTTAGTWPNHLKQNHCPFHVYPVENCQHPVLPE